MKIPSSSPRDESAPVEPGEGNAEIIAFPPARRHNEATPGQSAPVWPGQLIDLEMARALAGQPATPESPSIQASDSDGSEQSSPSQPVAKLSAPAAVTARNIALRSLATRARSVAETRQKLADRGVSVELIDEVVDGLVDEGLLDDTRLAHDLASRLQETKKMGPVAIRHTLGTRRIPRPIIDSVVDGLAAVDDEVLEQLVVRRAAQLRGLDRSTQVRRLVGYLARRGHQGPDVYRVVDRVLGHG